MPARRFWASFAVDDPRYTAVLFLADVCFFFSFCRFVCACRILCWEASSFMSSMVLCLFSKTGGSGFCPFGGMGAM